VNSRLQQIEISDVKDCDKVCDKSVIEVIKGIHKGDIGDNETVTLVAIRLSRPTIYHENPYFIQNNVYA